MSEVQDSRRGTYQGSKIFEWIEVEHSRGDKPMDPYHDSEMLAMLEEKNMKEGDSNTRGRGRGRD